MPAGLGVIVHFEHVIGEMDAKAQRFGEFNFLGSGLDSVCNVFHLRILGKKYVLK
jgi:hypothetical protein